MGSRLLVAAGLVAAALLALRVPWLGQNLAHNGAAVGVAALCAQTLPLGTPQPLAGPVPPPVAGAPWLVAVQARCLEDQVAEDAALRATVERTPARWPLAQARAPGDVALARLAVARLPDQASPHFWLGDALRQAGDRAAAAAAYAQGLALDPQAADAWDSLGRLQEQAGDLEAAGRAYDQACRYRDRGANGCADAGRVDALTGHYQAAVDHYQQALTQQGVYVASVERGLVNAYVALGYRDDAVAHLRVLAAHGDAEAGRLLSRLAPP